MKLSRSSTILLIMNIMLFPLMGNTYLFARLQILSIVQYIRFLIPFLYFISFIKDIYLSKKNLTNDINNFINNNKLILFSLFLYLILITISLFGGLFFKFKNITAYITFLYYIFFIITLYYYEIKEKEIKKIVYAVIMLFLIVSVIGIFQYYFDTNIVTAGIHKYPGATGRINSTMYIATILDKYLVWNLIFILYLLYKNKKNNYYIYILLLIGVLALSFTYSRTGIFTFYIIALIFLIIFLFQKKVINTIVVFFLIFFLYLLPGQKYLLGSTVMLMNNKINSLLEVTNLEFISPINNFFANKLIIAPLTNSNENSIDDKDEKPIDDKTKNPLDDKTQNTKGENNSKEDFYSIDASIVSRKYFQNVAKQIIAEYSHFGIGIGGYYYIYENQNVNNYLDNDIISNKRYMYPHNLYLKLAAEVGLLATVTLLVCFFIMLLKGFKNKVPILPLFLITSFLMFGFTEEILYMKETSFWFVIIYTLSTKYDLVIKKQEILK